MFLLRESDIPDKEIITGSMILEQSKKPVYYFKLISILPKILEGRLKDSSLIDEFNKYRGYIICGDVDEVEQFLGKIITQCCGATQKEV